MGHKHRLPGKRPRTDGLDTRVRIMKYISDVVEEEGRFPATGEIAEAVNRSQRTVQIYLNHQKAEIEEMTLSKINHAADVAVMAMIKILTSPDSANMEKIGAANTIRMFKDLFFKMGITDVDPEENEGDENRPFMVVNGTKIFL